MGKYKHRTERYPLKRRGVRGLEVRFDVTVVGINIGTADTWKFYDRDSETAIIYMNFRPATAFENHPLFRRTLDDGIDADTVCDLVLNSDTGHTVYITRDRKVVRRGTFRQILKTTAGW